VGFEGGQIIGLDHFKVKTKAGLRAKPAKCRIPETTKGGCVALRRLAVPHVVTWAEVLTALDYLPRDAYLTNVLRHAHGTSAAAEHAAAEAEAAEIVFLPEEIALKPADRSGSQLIVQPDAAITSPNTVVLLEAKATARHDPGRTGAARRHRRDRREPRRRLPTSRTASLVTHEQGGTGSHSDSRSPSRDR
jgi:hypothetical protein